MVMAASVLAFRAKRPDVLYQNIQVHNEHCGMIHTQEKERLQRDIDEELDQGFEGFLAMDWSLASCWRIWNVVVVNGRSTGS